MKYVNLSMAGTGKTFSCRKRSLREHTVKLLHMQAANHYGSRDPAAGGC